MGQTECELFASDGGELLFLKITVLGGIGGQ
jgi:hypothetical protein